MKKILFAALAVVAMGACQSGPKFEVKGLVDGAEGKTLYLEASTLEGIVPLDSVRLKKEGSFTFSQPRPESPEAPAGTPAPAYTCGHETRRRLRSSHTS